MPIPAIIAGLKLLGGGAKVHAHKHAGSKLIKDAVKDAAKDEVKDAMRNKKKRDDKNKKS